MLELQDVGSHHASMESIDDGRLQAPHAYQNGHHGRSSSLRYCKIKIIKSKVKLFSINLFFVIFSFVISFLFCFCSAIEEEIDLKVIIVRTGMFTMHAKAILTDCLFFNQMVTKPYNCLTSISHSCGPYVNRCMDSWHGFEVADFV